MKKFFCAVLCAVTLFYANIAWAGNITDSVSASVVVAQHPNPNWELSVKDADYNEQGNDISVIDTSSVQMIAMGSRRLVLGKVYLKLAVYDLYEVVVYTNSMDINNDGVPDTPWNWNYNIQKEDFISRHTGLQNQNPAYLDGEGFNSLLYGAALKIRAEEIHGAPTNAGPIDYDNDGDGIFDSSTSLHVNQTVPEQLWDGINYPDQIQFSYVPELATEVLMGMPLVKVAGSMYGSRLKNFDGTDNWLEMVFAVSEENVGSGLHSTEIYFDLRWN